ncbi:YfeC-like transcriptional regulator [Huaxiibacter chinensis]|uniref:YfeC-like transcriptional regulator n=1 Tax=Huaxiibacter chinensis TaxID=2899785 RepID=UPI003D31184F
MKTLRSKMTTEELSLTLGMAKQTVNRWIREKGWKTERINGVKGGRARWVHVDARVREHIKSLPAMRLQQAVYQLEETPPAYARPVAPALSPKITDVLEKMTASEQDHLERLLLREGINGFLTRLGIVDVNA